MHCCWGVRWDRYDTRNLQGRQREKIGGTSIQGGAKVYTIFCGEVVEKTAIEFRVNGFSKPGVSAVLATDTLAPAITPLRFAIGRTVFLTREKAEKVLKEVEQK